MAEPSTVDWDQIDFLLTQSDFEGFPQPEIPCKPTTEGKTRFIHFTDGQTADFITAQQNESTRRKTESNINQFRAFLQEKNDYRSPEAIPAAELDTLFSRFLLGARKASDGGEYEPTTLRGFLGSLDRYLQQKGCPYKTIKNPIFPLINSALIAKQKDLKSKGYGGKPNASEELSDVDIQQLQNEGIIGMNNPEALINLLHLNFSLVLGMRGRKEQRELKWGDIAVEVDEDGDKYLVHQKERSTKTRTGCDLQNVRKFKPKVWNNENKAICPVRAYELYKSKRPPSMCEPDSPFYLAVNNRSRSQSYHRWFKESPMGINHIYGLIPKMVQKCTGIDSTNRKVTNHSARKHLVQKCVDMGLAPTETVQISGHKSLESINNYSKMNVKKQKLVSRALGSCQSTNSVPAPSHTPLPSNVQSPTDHSNISDHAVCHHVEMPSSSNVSYSQQAMSSVFGSTTITGGTFIFNSGHDNCVANVPQKSPPAPRPKHLKRILPIMSDSDDD